MAEWKDLALNLILADGVVDDAEIRVLKKELLADDVIDDDEVQFLIDLRNLAQKKAKQKKIEGGVNPKFETFFFSAIEKNVLKDGKIDKAEADWLRDMLYADKKIDDNEVKFLKKLKKNATKTAKEFDALYEEAVGEPAAAPAKKKTTPRKKAAK